MPSPNSQILESRAYSRRSLSRTRREVGNGLRLAALIAAAWLGMVPVAQAKRYTFERISPLTGDGRTAESQIPEINDLGSVLHEGRLDDGREALVLVRNGTLTTVAEDRGAPYTGIRFNSTGDQQLNNLDEIVFYGETLADDSIFVWREEQLAAVYRTTVPNSEPGFTRWRSLQGFGEANLRASLPQAST